MESNPPATDCPSGDPSFVMLEDCVYEETVGHEGGSVEPALDPSFVVMEESDDEETIAEEEALEPEIDPQEELLTLAKDLNISLEELKAQSESHRSRRNRKKVDYKALYIVEQTKKQNPELLLKQPKSLKEMCGAVWDHYKLDTRRLEPSTSQASRDVSELFDFYMGNYCTKNEGKAEKDADYKPMLKPTFARKIRTGPDYQAEVPEGPITDPELDVYEESRDKLLWKPPPTGKEVDVEYYLRRVNEIMKPLHSKKTAERRGPYYDNEKALRTLLESNFNEPAAFNLFKQAIDYILRRKALSSKKSDEFRSHAEASSHAKMVRTKDTANVKVVGAKASRKTPPSVPTSSQSAGESSNAKNKYAGGNPYCPRETPPWQKPITQFFPASTDVTCQHCCSHFPLSEALTAEQVAQARANGQRGQSMTTDEPGPSMSTNQPRQSMAIYQPGRSMNTDQPGPSMSTNQPDQSLAIYQPGQSMTTNQPDQSMAIHQPGRSMATNRPGPSMGTNRPEPSMGTNRPGPSMGANQPEPSMGANQPEPSSIDVETTRTVIAYHERGPNGI